LTPENMELLASYSCPGSLSPLAVPMLLKPREVTADVRHFGLRLGGQGRARCSSEVTAVVGSGLIGNDERQELA